MLRYCLVLLFIFSAGFVHHANGKVHSVPGNTFTVNNHQQTTNVADTTAVHRKHKLIAALLAFPLGVFGLHRVYLGCPGKVPLLYIATLGGAIGVLPFIDFVLILVCKDVNVYAHNPHLFMWSKKPPKGKTTQP